MPYAITFQRTSFNTSVLIARLHGTLPAEKLSIFGGGS